MPGAIFDISHLSASPPLLASAIAEINAARHEMPRRDKFHGVATILRRFIDIAIVMAFGKRVKSYRVSYRRHLSIISDARYHQEI